MLHGVRPRLVCLFVVLLASTPALVCQEDTNEAPPEKASQLLITSQVAPKAVLRQPYSFELRAKGGTPPLQWSIEKGDLPPGLELNADEGVIAGVPTTPGEFRFTVRVQDSGKPSQSQVHEFVIAVVAPLALEWKRAPRLDDDGIYGAVRVTNGTGNDYDLTVIVVAVNDFDKAFALGYHHYTIQADQSQDMEFGSALPAGTYVVHVDAIGEDAEKNLIYRAHLQTPAPLVKK